ncbi:MAG TPA: hypothetical protein VK369_17060 [Segetibacter sp.]|nr:hypothetical protein [Segetibacter sp.]
MEAVIKLKPEELDSNLLSKIKQLVAGRNNIEVTISLTEKTYDYINTLNQSIGQLNNNETITMTMEEFLQYPATK